MCSVMYIIQGLLNLLRQRTSSNSNCVLVAFNFIDRTNKCHHQKWSRENYIWFWTENKKKKSFNQINQTKTNEYVVGTTNRIEMKSSRRLVGAERCRSTHYIRHYVTLLLRFLCIFWRALNFSLTFEILNFMNEIEPMIIIILFDLVEWCRTDQLKSCSLFYVCLPSNYWNEYTHMLVVYMRREFGSFGLVPVDREMNKWNHFLIRALRSSPHHSQRSRSRGGILLTI